MILNNFSYEDFWLLNLLIERFFIVNYKIKLRIKVARIINLKNFYKNKYKK